MTSIIFNQMLNHVNPSEACENEEEVEEENYNFNNADVNSKSFLVNLYKNLKNCNHFLNNLIINEQLNYVVISLFKNHQFSFGIKFFKSDTVFERVHFTCEDNHIVDYIDNEELPPKLIDVIEMFDFKNIYYNGCIISEIRDYRHSKSTNFFNSYFILLKPTSLSLYNDVKKIIGLTNASFVWTNSARLKLESKLIYLTSPKLCLDPNPCIGILSKKLSRKKLIFGNKLFLRLPRKRLKAVFADDHLKLIQKEFRLFEFLKTKKPCSTPKIKINNSSVKIKNIFKLADMEFKDVQTLAKELQEPKDNDSYELVKMEEYFIEFLDVPDDCTNLAIFRRPFDDIYFGNIVNTKDGDSKVGPHFYLGTKDMKSRYVDQFIETFSENGKKLIKITHKIGNEEPKVKHTKAVEFHRLRQQQNKLKNDQPKQQLKDEIDIINSENNSQSLVVNSITNNSNSENTSNEISTTTNISTNKLSNNQIVIKHSNLKLINAAKSNDHQTNSSQQPVVLNVSPSATHPNGIRLPLSFSYHLQQLKSGQITLYHKYLSTLNSINDNKEVSLNIIGNGAEGNPQSLFLNYRDNIFMFNCGEGLQRLISDFGFKSSKIQTLFLTSNQWYNISGLSSFLLSRFDSGYKHFNIHNRSNEKLIQHYLMFDTKLKHIQYKYLDSNDFTYEKLSIKAIPINFKNIKLVFYLGLLCPEKGKANLEKCFRLKVPRHLVSELEQDRCVVNKYGEIIQPSDVCYPDGPEQYFAIFECFQPKDYFDMLFSNDTIQNFLPKCEVIVHFTRDEYLSTKEYKDFISKYDSSKHFLITESNPPLSHYSSIRFQTQLNYLDPKLFPLQKSMSSEVIKPFNECNVINSPSGIKYIFRSLKSSDLSSISLENVPKIPTFTDSILHKDGSKRESIEESVNDLRIKQSLLPKSESRLYPEFIFLGTASSHSLPIRNVPIILVNLSEKHSILLDCGENAYGQLLKFYGQNKIAEVLNNIKVIFISHHHSDHHMGLVKIIEKHQKYCPSSNNLWIILPPIVNSFLNSTILNLPKTYNIVRKQYFNLAKSKIIKDLHINDINLVTVDHCVYACGITITDKENFKFVYSGDTKPCDELIKKGFNCDLLIHEATFEDGLSQYARAHFHSTLSEAINIGKSMKAGFTILTHFSQRYGKLPFVLDESFQNVGIAFDYMKINPSDFSRIPLLHAPLKCMYSKHLEKVKHRSEIYMRRFGQ